mmetsp:Transcript_49985/g.57537  ORF Transcript_49985/g.57537 Transcript_49985/m.57537 type:complete len:85 (-) Transcript_49985:229-483(-)|eukprot:CAMPEP_0176436924 /NCGR_PEP_ID=MMETSP0127-20121128/18284_1 /TAXON_ID=938130 /ORGANISM="Platyophrya macrostoma, Strain WH" /LENGTH=84 /DNA_ID=CAMNT_0017820389 /DNA_START=66 /DNA_END=320 /DNA_ORIENTATION=-
MKGGAQLSGADAAKEAIKKRGLVKSPTRGTQGGKPSDLKFFTDEAPGIKVTPKAVLITSFVYIGIVVLLHIFSKVRSGTEAASN